MFNIKNTVIAALLIGSVATQSTAQTEKETLTIPLSQPGKPGKLDVHVMRGSIHVSSHAGKDVIIEATAANSGKEAKKPEMVNGMRRLTPSGNDIDLTAQEEKNTVKVSTNFMRSTVNLKIKVPAQFAVKLSAINEGDIIVDDVSGELEINNINGGINLNNITGSAVANSINGNIKASFKGIDAVPMAFSSLNGNIDVTFPAAAKFDLKLKTDRGEILTDFDIAIVKTQPKSTTSSEKGMYKISKEDWVQGKVNGGGAEIMMKNMNADITVRKAK